MTEQQAKDFQIINGNNMEVLDTFADNSIDAIITDPPYELGFMGKRWDATGIAYNVELWKKALRVLKSGGYLLAFGGSRTYHRICCAIEDAGFEIRDCIMWLYGSGFPKSMNIGLAIDKKNGIESEVVGIGKSGVSSRAYQSEKTTTAGSFEIKKAKNKWGGWGTCLKPAYEPIIVARKPIENTIIDNVMKYGVGGINIDECRVGNETRTYKGCSGTSTTMKGGSFENGTNRDIEFSATGRFPANVILTYDETDENEVCGGMPNSAGSKGKPFSSTDYKEHETATSFKRGDFIPYNDEGNAARYFYCAKASKKDRDDGLDLIDETKNIHPTVKPVDLMQYLVRLVSPKGATILDIFNGSGSTGKAVAFENREREANYKYIGIELEKEYCDISLTRIDYALNKYEYDAIKEEQENKAKGQISLFDFEW